jgi:hypothetical protein
VATPRVAWVRSVIGKRTRLLIEVVRVRFPPDLLLRAATSVAARGARTAPFRDRLAGRTLVSETRNVGSTPSPGTKPRTVHRARPLLSENLAPLARPRRRSTLLHAAASPIFQRSRMVRQPTVIGPLEGSIPSAGAFGACALRRASLPARELRVRSCPCFSMVEHPPRTRCDPVRLRAWAPRFVLSNRPYTQ